MTPVLIPRRGAGFSLVELLVSVVVGMLALLFATRLLTSAEINRNASLGGSDAMQNGMLALFSMNGDAAQAGWGLNDTLVNGCNTTFSDTSGYALATALRDGAPITPMAAVIIQNNGANPDQVTFYSGSAPTAVGADRLLGIYTNGPLVQAASAPFHMAVGDVLLVAPEPASGGGCSLAQYAGPGANNTQLLVSAGAAFRFNRAAGLGNAYQANQARIYNLGPAGQLAFHTWSVNNGVLLLRATNLAGASAQPVSVIDNIVSIKAQYGFDNRVIAGTYDPSVNGIQVGQWSNTMINADGDGSTGGAGDFQRIAAVRLAVVARSKSPEKPDRYGICSATTTLPVVFGGQALAGVAPVPVSVNVAVPNDPIDWKCYRYRVFETIVQIRNSEWRP